MSVVLVEVLLIAVLVAANGLFAMAEMAVVSSRRARLQHLAEGGNRGAAAANSTRSWEWSRHGPTWPAGCASLRRA